MKKNLRKYSLNKKDFSGMGKRDFKGLEIMENECDSITKEEAIWCWIDIELDTLKGKGINKFWLMDIIKPISNPLEKLKVLRIIHYGKENLLNDLYIPKMT